MRAMPLTVRHVVNGIPAYVLGATIVSVCELFTEQGAGPITALVVRTAATSDLVVVYYDRDKRALAFVPMTQLRTTT